MKKICSKREKDERRSWKLKEKGTLKNDCHTASSIDPNAYKRETVRLISFLLLRICQDGEIQSRVGKRSVPALV